MCFILVFCTEQGSAIRSTGNNPQMSKAQGVNINFMKVLALCLSNGLVALSGGLMSQYQGFADIKMGAGAIVIGLAAVIIGEVLGGRACWEAYEFCDPACFCCAGRCCLLHRYRPGYVAENADRPAQASHSRNRGHFPGRSVSQGKVEKLFLPLQARGERTKMLELNKVSKRLISAP